MTLPAVSSLRARAEGLLENRDALDLCLTATCLLLAVDRFNRGIPVLLAVAALIFRPLQRKAAFWLVTAASLGWVTYQGWPLLDNHKYLIAYWAVSLGLCWLTPRPVEAIAWNGRMLIGLTFVLAAVQKAASPDFLSGTYFHFQLLQDSHFAPLARWVGGLSQEALGQNYHAMSALKGFDSTSDLARLNDGPWIAPLAQVMTWWTAGIEALVAAAFLWPRPDWISRWRDSFLLIFLFTTYALAHVVAFGWILVAMAIGQTDSEAKTARLLYMIAFLAMVAYAVPSVVYNWDVSPD